MLAALTRLERLHITNGTMKKGFGVFMEGLHPTEDAPLPLPALTALTVRETTLVGEDDFNGFTLLLSKLPSVTELTLNVLRFMLSRANVIGGVIARMPALTDLNINGMMYSAKPQTHLMWLRDCVQLRTLQMRDLNLQVQEVVVMINILHTCRHLHSLDVTGNMQVNVIWAYQARELTQALARLPALRSFKMSARFVRQEAHPIFHEGLPGVELSLMPAA
eukprot:3531147-Rhodomonas_salina.1